MAAIGICSSFDRECDSKRDIAVRIVVVGDTSLLPNCANKTSTDKFGKFIWYCNVMIPKISAMVHEFTQDIINSLYQLVVRSSLLFRKLPVRDNQSIKPPLGSEQVILEVSIGTVT